MKYLNSKDSPVRIEIFLGLYFISYLCCGGIPLFFLFAGRKKEKKVKRIVYLHFYASVHSPVVGSTLFQRKRRVLTLQRDRYY